MEWEYLTDYILWGLEGWLDGVGVLTGLYIEGAGGLVGRSGRREYLTDYILRELEG